MGYWSRLSRKRSCSSIVEKLHLVIQRCYSEWAVPLSPPFKANGEVMARSSPIPRTACVAALPVIQSWFLRWFKHESMQNPSINTPADGKVTTMAGEPKWRQGEAGNFLGCVLHIFLSLCFCDADTNVCGRSLVEYELHQDYKKNDFWAWGISLLQYLDPEYVQQTSFPEWKYTAFQQAFPASGPAKDAVLAREMLWDLRHHFSPIYDDKSWRSIKDEEGNRVSLGKVEEKWWSLLGKMLVRPDIQSEP